MTHDEIERWREYKAEVVDRLQRERWNCLRHYRYALVETDKRIGEYVLGVIDNPEGAQSV